MLARLAWANVRARESGVRDYHAVVTSAVSVFYAFNTLGEQQGFVAGGAPMPGGYADGVAGLTLVLACLVGVASLLLCQCCARGGRHQTVVLRMLGMGRSRLCVLLLLELGMVSLLGLAAGLGCGVLLSHVLVFVTARLVSGRVVGFGPFLSARGLVVAVAGLLVVLAITLCGILLDVLRRPGVRAAGRPTGSPWPRPHPSGLRAPVRLLALGLACHGLSYLAFVRASPGPTPHWAVTLVPHVGLLWAGLWLLVRGIAGLLAAWARRRRGHAGSSGVGTLTIVQAVRFLRGSAGTLSFAAVGLDAVVFVLTGALGGGLELVGGSSPSACYEALLCACELLPALMLLLFALVLSDVAQTVPDYLVLADLGCSRSLGARSVNARVALGFCVPAALALGHAIALFVLGSLGIAPEMLGALRLGLLAALAVVLVLLAGFAAFTRRHCHWVVEAGLRASGRRGR